MRQTIIDQMRNELYNNKLCIEDFEKYDRQMIDERDGEPFFWLVRPMGTHFVQIGPTAMRHFMENQACRFSWFRDRNAPIMSVTYWNEDPEFKYFFFDGLNLVRIEPDDVPEIFYNIWGNEYNLLKITHIEEFNMRDNILDVDMSDETREKYCEALDFADTLEDTSLYDCLSRLQHHARFSCDHKIKVYTDFAKLSFGFTEMIDGQPRLVGGIIYSEHSEKNRWSIHT